MSTPLENTKNDLTDCIWNYAHEGASLQETLGRIEDAKCSLEDQLISLALLKNRIHRAQREAARAREYVLTHKA